jgi:hypothetical protein
MANEEIVDKDVEEFHEEVVEQVEDEAEEQEAAESEGEEVEASAEGDETGNETDEERERIREHRRKERAEKKQRLRDKQDSMKRELAARDAIIEEMRAKLDAIERRNSGSEIAQLHQSKQEAAKAYQYFKDQIRLGTEAANGAVVAEATERMLQAQRRFEDLGRIEQAYRQRQAQPQPLDPRLVNHAQDWMSKNKWYDPNGRDPDSKVALTIDNALAEEGWNPTTPEYWQELSARLKTYLPHRVRSGKVTSTKPRSVVGGSGRESAPSGSAGTYSLSRERVQALKDAGVWDDPKARADAIKRFKDFDKQNTA